MADTTRRTKVMQKTGYILINTVDKRRSVNIFKKQLNSQKYEVYSINIHQFEFPKNLLLIETINESDVINLT